MEVLSRHRFDTSNRAKHERLTGALSAIRIGGCASFGHDSPIDCRRHSLAAASPCLPTEPHPGHHRKGHFDGCDTSTLAKLESGALDGGPNDFAKPPCGSPQFEKVKT